MRVQQENALALGNQKLEMVAIDAQAREVEAIHKEHAKITVKASQFWINFSSSVRPMLTYLIFLEFMTLTVMLAAGWIDAKLYSLIWDEPMQGILELLVAIGTDNAISQLSRTEIMICNEAGISLIKKWEGSHGPEKDGLLHSYICPASVHTIGWGTTYIDGSPVDAETTVTPESAESLLRHEVGRAEKAVEKLVTAELTENMFSALCSWTYNLGTGALQRSSLPTVVP